MLDSLELRDLYRRLSATPVATVFLDGSQRDPAQRTAWRRAYQSECDHLLSRLKLTRPADAAAAEASLKHIGESLRPHEGFLPSPSWVGVASPERLEWAEQIPIPFDLSVNWGTGPLVTPYLPVVGLADSLLMVVVDHTRGDLYAHKKGELTLKDTFEVEETFEAPVGVGVIKSAGGTTGFRGFPAKDDAQGALAADRERMFEAVRAGISRRAGEDRWILVCAPPDVKTSLSRGLGPDLQTRVLDGGSPDFSLSESDRLGLARDAIRQARQRRDRALLDQILNDLGPGGRGVTGRQDTLKALSQDAAGALLVSETMVRTEAHAVEPFVREALRSGADVRLCDGTAGDLLMQKGQGFAGQLRFAI